MKLTVYLDVLITINILINYFLLKMTAVIGKIAYSNKRIIFSAVVGALFSPLIFFDIAPILSVLIKTVSAVICTYTAFGFVSLGLFIKHVFYLMTATFIFTGTLYALPQDNSLFYLNNLHRYININPFLLVLCISVVYRVLWLWDTVYMRISAAEKMTCTVDFEGTLLEMTGFYDTGFNIRDILGHRAVMLCSLPSVKGSIDEQLYSALEDFINGKLNRDIKLQHVFYSDISKQGILPAVRPKAVKIREKEIKNVLIAFTDSVLGDDVQIIFGKDIFDMTGEWR